MKLDRFFVLAGTLWCALWLCVWVSVTGLSVISINLCGDGSCDASSAVDTLRNISWWAIPLFGAGTYFGCRSIWPNIRAAFQARKVSRPS
jgi:hypothetical protein